MKKSIRETVREAIEPTVSALGYSIWDIVYSKIGADYHLEITIDKEDGINIEDCERVLMDGFKVTNSPAWTIHPLRCENVTISGLTVINPADSPNTDGIDPDGCQDVRISDCTIDVGDDCIAVKSGTEKTPDRQPSERIIITNCHFLHGHGGVVLGSEMSGGVRNVVVSSCVFSGTDRGVRLKTRRGRGGAECGQPLRRRRRRIGSAGR